MRLLSSLRRLVFVACPLACLALGPLPATAKVSSDSPYSRAQTYNAALRYIRVDQGYELVEQDRDTGYLIFNYRSDTETSSGSIEVLQVNDRVKVIIQLPRMPEYHEQVLTNGLQRKLREEYGEPPRREPKKPKDDTVRRPDDRTPDQDGSTDGTDGARDGAQDGDKKKTARSRS